MSGLAKVVAQLAAARRSMAETPAEDSGGLLKPMAGFGSNPGNLIARTFIPANLPKGAPLVVVLHGCTQNAAQYDRGSGWSQLAASEGFALLYPEQQRSNNSNLCLNWFAPEDARRGQGEALSISQMVKHMTAAHGLDETRVYVTGLSAGGAMTSALLASYPELFAGGAIIAGLPFASANSLPEALARMRGQGSPGRNELASRARTAAPHSRRMPSVSVWHGTQDAVVDPSNSAAIVDQWRDLHGLGTATGTIDSVDGHRHETWRDADGRAIIERYDIRGMGHGTPLATGGADACGKAGPHMLEAGICSTSKIAAFWGLTSTTRKSVESKHEIDRPVTNLTPEPANPQVRDGKRGGDVQSVIEKALRSAGLMK